jgi:hypothetical protein
MPTILLPLRNVNLSLPQLLTQLYADLAASLVTQATQALNAYLDAWVTEGLERVWYERREHIRGLCRFECQRCGSRLRRHFTRHGYRRRRLTLALGTLALQLPRLVCTCGGSVRLHLPGLRPGQRLGDDLTGLVQHWAHLAYSLRGLKAELDNTLQTSLGLRSLNDRLRQVAAQVPAWYERWLEDVPPVVVLDAVWLTLLRETPEFRRDRRGRRRRVKARVRLPVMVALGVWPEDGRSAVLDWELGDGPGEDQASWLRLLYRLEERGLRAQRGLSLFIHDGADGLMAALRQAFAEVPHQRCVFHKLRNVWQAVVLPEDRSPDDRRAYRRTLIRQAARIWQAPSEAEAWRRYHTFCADWRDEQPAAVLTLQRQFTDTLTFYTPLERHRLWSACHVRSTSRLERLNRKVRARMRRAGAFHSKLGLQAMLVQVLGVL